jgi:hypothetical protein
MRRSSVIAIQEEIGRLLCRINSFEREAQRCRDFLAVYPCDPVDAAQAVRGLLDEKNIWQDALNMRVLQLAGVDPGVTIETTWVGSSDPRLV